MERSILDPGTPTSEPRPRKRPGIGILWLLGALLIAYSAIIASTDGINVTIGGVRLRSRTWQRPAVAGLLCLAVVAVRDRRRAARVARASALLLVDRSTLLIRSIPPVAMAVAALVWALVVGVVFSTSAAGGADASGYLNQARLFSSGRLLEDQRITPLPPWRDPTFNLAPLGFRPAPDRTRLAPTYPPGYPLLMAPAFLVDVRAAYLVVPFCGALAIWLTYALGRELGYAHAGAAAAILASVSPTFLYQIVQPMSDVPCTAAWLLSLYFALKRTSGSAALSGLAAGAAILIRPNLMPLALLVWLSCAWSDRSKTQWARLGAAVVATMAAILVLFLLQSIRYGSPLASGYGSFESLFQSANVRPNLERYPRWMFETHTPAIAGFLLAPLWIAWRQQSRQFYVLWTFAVGVVLAYLPYVYFQMFEWMYTRFLLPAIPLMWLLIAAPVEDLVRRLRPTVAILVTAPILLPLMAFCIYGARARYAFELHVGERKYVEAGAYVRARLPSNAVVISMQHSGSIWFYTSRPILRWDNLDPARLDAAIAWLAANGYVPYMALDREEFEKAKARFLPARQQTLSRVRPLMQHGDVTVYALD